MKEIIIKTVYGDVIKWRIRNIANPVHIYNEGELIIEGVDGQWSVHKWEWYQIKEGDTITEKVYNTAKPL